MLTHEFRAMNTSVLLALETYDGGADGLQAAQNFIQNCEQRFSRFLPNSELSRLNQCAGEWRSVSADLMEMLTLSLKYYEETNGLFDPSILPDLKRVGYDRSMDEVRGRITAPASKRTPRPALSEIEFDLPRERVRLPRGVEIDLGGIAKGWIVDKAATLLSAYSMTCAVSAGGDIRFVGYPMGLLNWRVELEDPRNPSQTAAVLFVGEGALVTSSISKRTWNQSGQTRHHLIDPRTGEPAESDWQSVTVITPNIMDAEVYAKALLIGGEAQAARLTDDMAYITIDSEGALSGSSAGKEYLNEFNFIGQK